MDTASGKRCDRGRFHRRCRDGERTSMSECLDGGAYITEPKKPSSSAEPTTLSKSVLKRQAAMGRIYEPGFVPTQARFDRAQDNDKR